MPFSLNGAMQLQLPKFDIFERLEREANDELLLLDELGPTYFGTDHLIELHEILRDRLALAQRRQRFVFASIGGLVGWAVLAGLARFMGYYWLALGAFGLLTLSAGLLFFVLFRSRHQRLFRGHLEYDLRLIEEELRKRGLRKNAVQ